MISQRRFSQGRYARAVRAAAGGRPKAVVPAMGALWVAPEAGTEIAFRRVHDTDVEHAGVERAPD